MAKFSKLLIVAGSVIILTMCLPAYADENNKPAPLPNSGDRTFAGIKFGVGVALTVGIGENTASNPPQLLETGTSCESKKGGSANDPLITLTQLDKSRSPIPHLGFKDPWLSTPPSRMVWLFKYLPY